MILDPASYMSDPANSTTSANPANRPNPQAASARARRWRRVGALLAIPALVTVAALLWALFWQDENCSEPACARQRYSLAIELDRFERVEPIALEVKTREGPVSVSSVLASGGVEVQVHPTQNSLPLAAASGKLDHTDLYRFARVWRSLEPVNGVDAQLYAMLAPNIVSESGEDLFGVMFDTANREGFAVAPAELAKRFDRNGSDQVPVLQLRTFLHELLHALNRRHSDAAQMPGNRLTIEAPTKCIAGNTHQRDWTLREPPLLALSPSTILFFQSAPRAEVLPGERNAPFLSGRIATEDCEDARAIVVEDPATSRWRFALKRLKSLLTLPVAAAATEEPEQQEQDQDSAQPMSVQLRLQALDTPYPFGYPVAVRVTALNTGARELPLVGRLLPGYGLVRIETRRAGDEEWAPLQPGASYEPIDDDEAMLAAGQRTEQTVPIFFQFQNEGWTFPEPGEYQVRARLRLSDDQDEVVTDLIKLVIEAPRTKRDRAALRLLLDENGKLRIDLGRVLAGRHADDGDETAATILTRLTAEHGDTALGAAYRLSRAAQMLRRPINPLTGERPPPDTEGAKRLLAGSCTDSGVAALRRQLVEFHLSAFGVAPEPVARTPVKTAPVEIAWEGNVPRRKPPLATYSDPALTVARRTFQFCYNEAQLRDDAAISAENFADDLRRLNPKRVIVVGHADHEGVCSYNDGLALRRAEAMRKVLVAAGIRGSRIQVAGLGERRPRDFAATPAVDALNRRVEVLLPPEIEARLRQPKSAAAAHMIPDCRAPAF